MSHLYLTSILEQPSAYLFQVLAECHMNFSWVLSTKSAGKKAQPPNRKWLGDFWFGLVFFWLWLEHRWAKPSLLVSGNCCYHGYVAARQGDPYSVFFFLLFLPFLPGPTDLVFLLFPISSQHQTGAQLVHPGFSHSLTGGGWYHLLPRRCFSFQGDANGVCQWWQDRFPS